MNVATFEHDKMPWLTQKSPLKSLETCSSSVGEHFVPAIKVASKSPAVIALYLAVLLSATFKAVVTAAVENYQPTGAPPLLLLSSFVLEASAPLVRSRRSVSGRCSDEHGHPCRGLSQTASRKSFTSRFSYQ